MLILFGLGINVLHDPFFGDAVVSTSLAANNIYDHGLSTIFYPIEKDPGHPTIYPYFLAVCWTLFGKSLAVAHIVQLLLAAGMLLIVRNIAKPFCSAETANTIVLWVAVCPVFLAQSAMLLGNFLMLVAMLAAVSALLSNNKWMQLFAMSLMMLSHLQGAFWMCGIASADLLLFREKEGLLGWLRRSWWVYAVPFAVFVIWLTLHYQHTGWLVNTPAYTNRGSTPGWNLLVKNAMLVVWRLLDFGMIAVYALAAIAIWKAWIPKRYVQMWFLLTGVFILLLLLLLHDSFGHRYFLGISVLAIIGAGMALDKLSLSRRMIAIVFVTVSLITGNWLYYPGKNLGDGTLAYRDYFLLEKQVKQDLENQPVYSYAPIANDSKLTWLDTSGLNWQRITDQPFDSLPIIIQSNVNAEFSEADKQWLSTHFYGKSYEAGVVYVNVFLNPAFYAKPQGWTLRKPSQFEEWIIQMKQ